MTREMSQTGRLGPTFHRTFALVRPALTQVLEVLSDSEGSENGKADRLKERLRDETTLGSVYIDAMPRYAVGTGLLEDSKSNRLTMLGRAVIEYDPQLNHPATLWLMHYHLSAPRGPGPAFWHYLITHVFNIGDRLQRFQILEALDAFLRSDGSQVVDKQLNATVSIFTGTYTKSDALGKLGILTSETGDDKSGTFEVQEPLSPPTFALGYALAHYWGQEVNALRAPLSSLSAPGGFASLFFIGNYALNSALRELQREGYLELEQISPPHQIVRRWERKEDFLERLYE